MYKDHPVFEKPEDENAKIWRYMDFNKFVSLLDKSALFFSRADKLGDPFEGSYSKANVRLRPEVYKDKIPANVLKTFSEFSKLHIRFTAINCWHLNEYESAAMWKLYLKSDDGIALRSTFKGLKDCLKDENENIFIGKVKYIDYETEWMPEGNSFYPFLHKRKSFENEQELRAIIQKYRYKKNGEIGWSTPPFDDGVYVKVDLSVLIDKIYLAPTSPRWLFELVKSVTKMYKLDRDVLQSSLDDVPVY
ncbi:MAG TPA: DUF2971 domain-containing protein [Dehalococcoidia bacterium]|nr:DUF2971 domain-containing protein [Dehalococcoidia bacterium]